MQIWTLKKFIETYGIENTAKVMNETVEDVEEMARAARDFKFTSIANCMSVNEITCHHYSSVSDHDFLDQFEPTEG